jgi:hypothetical protein
MTVEALRRFAKASPFHPFLIRLADGRTIHVVHHDYIISSPQGRTAVVYQPDDSFEVIDLLLVSSLLVKPKKSVKNGK